MNTMKLVMNVVLIVTSYLLSFLIVKALEPILPAFAFVIIIIYIFDFVLGLISMGVKRVTSFRAAAVIFLVGCILAIIAGVYLTFALLDIIKIVATILLTILIFRGLHGMFLGGEGGLFGGEEIKKLSRGKVEVG